MSEISLDDFDDKPKIVVKPTDYVHREQALHQGFIPAEAAVLGAIMVDERIFDSVFSIAPPTFFSDPVAKRVYMTMEKMHEKKEVIDTITVNSRLLSEGYEYGPIIISFIDACVTTYHAQAYARMIAGTFYDREIIRTAGLVAVSAGGHMDSTDKTIEKVNDLKQAVLSKERLGLPLLFNYEKDLHDVLDAILAQSKVPLSDTGFAVLDRELLGVRAGEVITWGAAPNVGKSLMLLNLAHVAARTKRVLYVGTEMSAQETVQRHLSIANGVEPWKLRKGKVSIDEVRGLTETLGDKMSHMPLSILDYPEPTVENVDAAITASGAEVVFLDYLERFKLPKADEFRLRVNEFMRRIKNLARERKVVIHLASQLGRSTYGKDERKPTMADLSESSGIEKESDRVILLWAPKEKQDVTPQGRKVIEAILEKNRHGKKGLIFDLILSERNLRITSEAESNEPSFFEDQQGTR